MQDSPFISRCQRIGGVEKRIIGSADRRNTETGQKGESKGPKKICKHKVPAKRGRRNKSRSGPRGERKIGPGRISALPQKILIFGNEFLSCGAPKDEFIALEFDMRGGETEIFPRAEMVAATDEILTDNGVRSQGSPEILAVWTGKPAR
jgi:hypothetical protein